MVSKSKKSKKKRETLTSDNDSTNRSPRKKDKKSKTKRSRKHSKSRHSRSNSARSEFVKSKPKKSSNGYSSGSSTDGEWVEQVSKMPSSEQVSKMPSSDQVSKVHTATTNKGTVLSTVTQRDSWMTDGITLKTFQIEKIRKSNENNKINDYDPARSNRELNPYWKTTGTGLPTTFQKPGNDSDEEGQRNAILRKGSTSYPQVHRKRNWQKESSKDSYGHYDTKSHINETTGVPETKSSSDVDACKFLTDVQMNELGAKIIKAEIMGNNAMAKELKEKLDTARANMKLYKETKALAKDEVVNKDRHLLLTSTDSRGNCRPLQQTRSVNRTDSYGGRSDKRKANRRRETHESGERVRFFADDDKFNIKEMFEREKYTSAAESNIEFAHIMSKHKSKNDDMEDIFTDTIRKQNLPERTDKKEFLRSIHEEKKFMSKLDSCQRCLDGGKVDKKAIISIGEKIYLSLPWHVGLQLGHCTLATTQHAICSTLVDEDIWEEIMNFRKKLTKMYAAQNKEVIFFEIANKLKSKPHMCIHCVPILGKDAEVAPFYFKKAIEESEHQWSVNKQLIHLGKKDLRSSIPRGLPYIWVNFGMTNGFAHVIEDEERFPSNFAHEIIGGILQLDPQSWRHPQKEHNMEEKAKRFCDNWKKYDC